MVIPIMPKRIRGSSRRRSAKFMLYPQSLLGFYYYFFALM
jgi:hypothetical protein